MDDKASQLFKLAMQGVTPLTQEAVVVAPLPPIPTLRKKSTEHVTPTIGLSLHIQENLTAEAPITFQKPGLRPLQWRRLQHGRERIEATLDLHGYTLEDGQTALLAFLDRVYAKGMRTVCIVHGKGSSAHPYPRMKNAVATWLPQIPIIIAYCSAPPRLGGTGAVLVQLNAKKQ